MIISKSKELSIILPENARSQEIFAADELGKYLEMIFGIKAKIGGVLKNTTENILIIGSPARNAAARELISEEAFDAACPGPEGFVIISRGSKLLLAGSEKCDDGYLRGTIYAIYEFLESKLGCSFAVYSSDALNCGEYIPEYDEISIDDFELIKPACDLEYRTAVLQYDNWAGNPNHILNLKFFSWLAKNRYNRILTWSSIYEGLKKNGMLDEAEKRGIRFSVGHHEATKLFLPPDGNEYFPEKYYATHPEYYKLKADGTRHYMGPTDYDGQLILCMRNPDCIRQFAENIIIWAKENPVVDIITIWPNDGMADGCLCELCRDIPKNQNYTYFVNEVAKIVNRVLPHMQFDRISYHDLITPEADTTLEPSVIIDASVWQKGGLRPMGKPDGSCMIDTQYDTELLAWMAKGAKGVFYEYYMGNYSARERIVPMADELRAVCAHCKRLGIYGIGTQIECYNLWNNILNFYTFGRTAYDVSLSLEDNLDRFTRIFGEGAPYVKKILLHLEDVYDGQVRLNVGGIYLIEHADKAMVYELFEKAYNLTRPGAERNALRLMRMTFRYSDLEVNSCENPTGWGCLSKSADENGELEYMRANFNSYRNPDGGDGISIAVEPHESSYVPDKWYTAD